MKLKTLKEARYYQHVDPKWLSSMRYALEIDRDNWGDFDDWVEAQHDSPSAHVEHFLNKIPTGKEDMYYRALDEIIKEMRQQDKA